jgi:acyl-CoA synthetase (NDP forming)
MTAQAGKDLITCARAAGRSALDEASAKSLLAGWGIRTPRSVVVANGATAPEAVARLTPPFAVKVVSPDILHKSDVGGVMLGLPDGAAVAAAIASMAAKPRIASAHVEGWLIEEMIPAGREVVIGGFKDPQFGPMIMAGLGGVLVEVLEDVAFRICPLTRAEAADMLTSLKGARLLDSVRGQRPVDKNALIDVIVRIGGENGLLMSLADEIAEADLNPVIVNENGVVAADARFILADRADAPQVGTDSAARPHAFDEFRPLFEPKTIAVLGASSRDVAIANTFIRRLKAFGFSGAIYPIHPNAGTIEGLQAYPSFASLPQSVDYAYVAIGAERIPAAIAEAKGRCRIAQVISSGFGEVSEGKALEQQLVEQARIAGVRILGPNTLGAYSPRGGLTFPEDAPKEVGTIGIVAQSGGLSTDIIKRGQWRGLRLSGLMTIGNSADVTPAELVAYYLADPQTKAIGLYIEDIKGGREFFELMRSAQATKPVVILRGGATGQGRAAALSHTGALAGEGRAWDALAAQTPVALVDTVEMFLDSLVALQCLTLNPNKPTRSVTLFGNGGGSSVLGADAFAHCGLDVSAFGAEARDRLEAMKLPPGTSVANPIDTPVRTLQEKDGWVAGEILDIVYTHARPDAVAIHLNLAAFVGRGSVDPVANLFTVIEQTQTKWPGAAHVLLALRSDGSRELDDKKRDYRLKAVAAGIPVFDEIPEMAQALSVVSHLERALAAQQRRLDGLTPATPSIAASALSK